MKRSVGAGSRADTDLLLLLGQADRCTRNGHPVTIDNMAADCRVAVTPDEGSSHQNEHAQLSFHGKRCHEK
jgi:hypothetical protein